jgi:hypothetical protein
MLDIFKQHPETTETDRAIVLLINGDDKHGGIGLRGYDDDKEAVVDLVIHLKGILRANGQDLHIIPIGSTPPEETP